MPRRKRTYRRKTNATTRKIARVARAVVNRAIETKEKRYDYSSVGIDPVGGSAVTFGSISYGGSACIAQLCRGINTRYERWRTSGSSDHPAWYLYKLSCPVCFCH